ncbi:MAG TPA: ferritin-like domain-containing protein [Mycobacteriales bacterium]|nr:ferritin-like domain-containing protein [Mycobacteriales bacterium]
MELRLDEARFAELMEESQDLHSDAMRSCSEPLNRIVEAGQERRAASDYDEQLHHELAETRRRAVTKSLAGAGLAVGTFAAFVAATASPAFAQDGGKDIDIDALQTAVSLELLAVETYKTALTLDYVKANKTITAFAQTTMMQHAEHGKAFNAKAVALGGKEQTMTNPKYTPVVTGMVPALKKGGPLDVVKLAITLEDVATSTYVKNIAENVTDPETRFLFGTVASVESQHLGTLNAVKALLEANAPQFITVKATGGAVDLAKLPGPAGAAFVPETFKKTDLASPPEEGAVA